MLSARKFKNKKQLGNQSGSCDNKCTSFIFDIYHSKHMSNTKHRLRKASGPDRWLTEVKTSTIRPTLTRPDLLLGKSDHVKTLLTRY